MKSKTILALVCITLPSLVAVPTASAEMRYTITDLGTLGGARSEAWGINENGQVVGSATTVAGATNAFLYSNGVMTNLGTLGGADSVARGINDSGQITGYSAIATGAERAFLYSHGTMTNLGTLGGTASYAYAINAGGQVIGAAQTANNAAYRAFIYGGTMTNLGTLGGAWSWGWGINNNGHCTGWAYTSDQWDAFIRTNSMRDLGTLGGPWSWGADVNLRDEVVGESALAGDTASRGFIYSNGHMTGLPTLGGNNSLAWHINDFGQVVGRADTATTGHAFIYWNGTMTDLNNLIPGNSGWVLNEAHAINNRGQIVGTGTIGGQSHAFLLMPIPPQLAIASMATNIAISWSSNCPGFALESAGQLAGTWTPVSGVTGYSATLPVNPETNRFFRLKK